MSLTDTQKTQETQRVFCKPSHSWQTSTGDIQEIQVHAMAGKKLPPFCLIVYSFDFLPLLVSTSTCTYPLWTCRTCSCGRHIDQRHLHIDHIETFAHRPQTFAHRPLLSANRLHVLADTHRPHTFAHRPHRHKRLVTIDTKDHTDHIDLFHKELIGFFHKDHIDRIETTHQIFTKTTQIFTRHTQTAYICSYDAKDHIDFHTDHLETLFSHCWHDVATLGHRRLAAPGVGAAAAAAAAAAGPAAASRDGAGRPFPLAGGPGAQ